MTEIGPGLDGFTAFFCIGLSIWMKRGQLSINDKTTKSVVPKSTHLLTVKPLHIPGSHSVDIHIVSKNVERS